MQFQVCKRSREQMPRFLGASSGITLARMVMASIRADALPASPLFPQQHPRNHSSFVSASASASTSALAPAVESSLPPRHAADNLVEVYFQYRTPHLPIVERAQVEKALDSAYSFVNDHPRAGRVVERD